MTKADFTPENWPQVIPRLSVEDPEGLVSFLQDVFDANGEFQKGRPSEMWIGRSLIMVGGTQDRAATSSVLYVYVQDVDSTHQRALALGAEQLEAPAEMPYGDRRAMFIDPWGTTWQVATHRGWAGAV